MDIEDQLCGVYVDLEALASNYAGSMLTWRHWPPSDGGGDGDGGDVPRTLSIWLGPGSITPRDQISRAGNPSLRFQYIIGRRNKYASLDTLNMCIFCFGLEGNDCTKNAKQPKKSAAFGGGLLRLLWGLKYNHFMRV